MAPSVLLGGGSFPSTNELNQEKQARRQEDAPYVSLVEAGLGYIELEFINASPYLAFFEYRIDGEVSPYLGTEWENTHPLVDEEGNWRYGDPDYDYDYPHFESPGPGNYYRLIGLDPSGSYNDIRVEHAQSRRERFEVSEMIEVRLAYADELEWCFGWTAFYSEKPVVVAKQNEGGIISPSGEIPVTYGSGKIFTIEADPGARIADVLVDGESVGPVSSYAFYNITSHQTIEPFFDTFEGGAAEFVTMLYNNILGRDPDPGGLSDHVSAINEQGMAGKQVAVAIMFSSEGQDITAGYDNTQFVAFLYRSLLGREPDEGGMMGWVAALYAGMSRKGAAEGFLRSPEWEEVCNRYQVKPY